MIIAILSLLVYPAVGWYRARAQGAACTQNLRALYTATSSYLNASGGVWPQIPYTSQKREENARAWHDLLKPYGLDWINWICPSVQSTIGNPDVTKFKMNRSDYAAMPFDAKPNTAHRWANQPWFAERQAVHVGGNLIVTSNGAVMTLSEAAQLAKQPQTPP